MPNYTVEWRAIPATPRYGTLSTRDSLDSKSKLLPRVRSNRWLGVKRASEERLGSSIRTVTLAFPALLKIGGAFLAA
jgi:hypothetical protein